MNWCDQPFNGAALCSCISVCTCQWIAKMAIFFLMCIVLFFFWCVNLSWGKRTCVLVCNKFDIINIITIFIIQYRYCCLLGVAAHNKNISSWMMNYSTGISDAVRIPEYTAILHTKDLESKSLFILILTTFLAP